MIRWFRIKDAGLAPSRLREESAMTLSRFTVQTATLTLALTVLTGGCIRLLLPPDSANGNTSAPTENENKNDSAGNTNANEPQDNSNINDSPPPDDMDPDVLPPLTIIKTDIFVHNQARIAAGDHMIVFGTGSFAGVGCIIPSAGDTVARAIPGGNAFNPRSFAVSGRYAAFVDTNFQVNIFNANDDSITTIAVSQIQVASVQSDIYEPGHMQADGPLFVVRNHADAGSLVKVIDVTDGSPSVIGFATDPSEEGLGVSQVAVDAEMRQAVAVSGEAFYVYDIDDPQADPARFDLFGSGGIGGTQIMLDGGLILCHDDEDPPNAVLLDVASGESTILAHNPAAEQLALAGGSLGYFLGGSEEDSIGTLFRSAIGTTQALAQIAPAELGAFINAANSDDGAIGFGQNMTITPDGRFFLLAGKTSIGSGEFLQAGVGGGFTVLTGPEGGNPLGCPASDVHASDTIVAFKTGSSADTTLGYLVLPTK
jgi:hypothetical protein